MGRKRNNWVPNRDCTTDDDQIDVFNTWLTVIVFLYFFEHFWQTHNGVSFRIDRSTFSNGAVATCPVILKKQAKWSAAFANNCRWILTNFAGRLRPSMPQSHDMSHDNLAILPHYRCFLTQQLILKDLYEIWNCSEVRSRLNSEKLQNTAARNGALWSIVKASWSTHAVGVIHIDSYRKSSYENVHDLISFVCQEDCFK